jgi:adenylate kinase family enzyme
VAVLGTASGCGKTTVGRALAARLGVPFVELDALNQGPGWIEATPEELRAKVGPILEGDAWVIDGGRGLLFLFALRRSRTRRRDYPTRLARFDVVRLRSQREVDRWLETSA